LRFIDAGDPLVVQAGSTYKRCEPAVQISHSGSSGQLKRIATSLICLLAFRTGLRRAPPDDAFLFESNDLNSSSGDCGHGDRIWTLTFAFVIQEQFPSREL
jgi:hypothetical protein